MPRSRSPVIPRISEPRSIPAQQRQGRGRADDQRLPIGRARRNSQTFAAVKDTALKIDLTASFVAEARIWSRWISVSAPMAVSYSRLEDGPVPCAICAPSGAMTVPRGGCCSRDAAIDADKIAGRFQGRADFITDSTNKIARINADLQITKLSLAFPKYFAQPVSFSLVDIRGSWLPETRDLVFDHLGVTGASLNLQASGKLTFVPNLSPALETKGTFAAMNVRDLVHYWPLLAAGGARSWVEANMFAGTIGPIVFETHLTPGMIDAPSLPDNALSAKFALLGGEANYIKGLTHLTEIQAAAKLTGASFALEVSSAKIGPLVLTGGRFAIADLNVANEIGEITGHMKGSMSDVLALVDMPPLGYPTRFGIGAANSKGAAALDISVQVPMQHTVSVDQVAVAVKAAVSGFAISLGPHTRMTDGTIAFSVDNSKLHATGTTGIGGSASRIAVDWTEDFKTVGAVTTKIAVKGMVDDQARAASESSHKGLFARPDRHQRYADRSPRRALAGQRHTGSHARDGDTRSDRSQQTRRLSRNGTSGHDIRSPQHHRRRKSASHGTWHFGDRHDGLRQERKIDSTPGAVDSRRTAGRFLSQSHAQCFGRRHRRARPFARRLAAGGTRWRSGRGNYRRTVPYFGQAGPAGLAQRHRHCALCHRYNWDRRQAVYDDAFGFFVQNRHLERFDRAGRFGAALHCHDQRHGDVEQGSFRFQQHAGRQTRFCCILPGKAGDPPQKIQTLRIFKAG